MTMEEKREHEQFVAAVISEGAPGGDRRDRGSWLLSCVDVVAGDQMKGLIELGWFGEIEGGDMTEPHKPTQEAVLVERGLFEQVVEGLRFYADPQSYGMSGGTVDRIIQDAGKRAQHLLAQLTEKQP